MKELFLFELKIQFKGQYFCTLPEHHKIWRPTFSSYMLWTEGAPITKLCQKAWYIRIRPWKRKHGSVQRRITGVSLEKTIQSLSFSFDQLSFIKTIYQKLIKRAWGQLYAYISLFATAIEKTMNWKSISTRSYSCVCYILMSILKDFSVRSSSCKLITHTVKFHR